MQHGSLETWLRNRADDVEALRLKICLGSTRGLMFLHHGFVSHIIHLSFTTTEYIYSIGW
jgi:hypothetical protein